MRHTTPHVTLASRVRGRITLFSVGTITVFALVPAFAAPDRPPGGDQPHPQGDAPRFQGGDFGGGPRRGGGGGQGPRGMGPQGRSGPMPQGRMMPGRGSGDWDGPNPMRPLQSPLESLTQHHQQGIELAKLAATRSNRSELKKFAQKLITTQTTQLAQLNALQQATAKTAPSPQTGPGMQARGMMNGMRGGWGQGGESQGLGRQGPNPGGRGFDSHNWGGQNWNDNAFTPGGFPRGTALPMGASQERMTTMTSATDFDRSFVQAMIGYQAEAILAAQASLHNNTNLQVAALAGQIVSQSASNIAQLSEWNRRWYRGVSPITARFQLAKNAESSTNDRVCSLRAGAVVIFKVYELCVSEPSPAT